MAEHLDACVLPRPDGPGCGKVREQYGLCPDHDGWCAPGCPVTGGGWPQVYAEQAPADGAEPDRAAEYERTRRAALASQDEAGS